MVLPFQSLAPAYFQCASQNIYTRPSGLFQYVASSVDIFWFILSFSNPALHSCFIMHALSVFIPTQSSQHVS
jgi:hypothetical protein